MKSFMKFLHIIPWIIILSLGYITIENYTRSMLPNNRFMEIKTMIVNDTLVGDTPILVFERVINQEFVAEWTVTVRSVTNEGLVTVCHGRGRDHYSPAGRLPNPVSLNWWLGNNSCRLPLGKYRIDTSWEIIGETNRIIRAGSNIFTVYNGNG